MSRPHARRLYGAAAAALLLATATLLAQTASRQLPYENLKAVVQGLKVTVTYDLVSADPAYEVFSVSLEVRLKDSGQLVAVNPASLSGDGLGTRLSAGRQKKIVWNAGQFIETPQFELYEYSLIIESVTGQLQVQTTPPGASVKIDGESQSRGLTPLTFDVKPGPHTVVVSKDGYLDNSRQEIVEAGKLTQVTRPLTIVPKGSLPGPGGTVVPPKKGGIPIWIIPAAGGGAAAALLALKGKPTPVTNNTTVACSTLSATPTSFPNPTQAGGTVAVTVTIGPSGCSPQAAWTAAVASDSTSFLHVSPAGGTGSGSFNVTLDANTPDLGVASRNGSLTISGPTLAGTTFTVTGQSNAVTTAGISTSASEAPGSPSFPPIQNVTVVAGQKLTISTTGSGSITVLGIGSFGPGGLTNQNAGSQGRLPGQPAYALICGINGQTLADLKFVGTGISITADVGGPLFCGMNAPNAATGYTGTSGSWTVSITIGG